MKATAEMKCPHCGMVLNLNEIYTEEMRREFDEKNTLIIQKEVESKREKIENEARKRIEEAVKAAENEKELQISKMSEQIRFLTEANEKQNKQMLEDQKQQLELQEKLRQTDLEIQRKVKEISDEIYQKARKDADEAKEFEIAKLNKKIDDANKVSEDLQKKLDQGSQQLQGEIQELKLEDCLRAAFPLDTIEEVGKGKKGADVIQTVIGKTGKVCGKIVWESKNVKTWSNDFIPKLRSDAERVGGDVAILVSNVFGKGMCDFTLNEGVWLVKPQNALSIARVIRNGVENISNTKSLTEKKETIQEAVYTFVTSTAFRNRIENIGRQYRTLDAEIDKTKDAMNKHWSTQRKLIDELVDNTEGILGEVNAYLLQADNRDDKTGETGEIMISDNEI